MTIQEQAAPSSAAGLASTPAERDRMLAQAYVAGDDDAFAIIVFDHYDSLLARARRLVGSSGQPEDAVQETFYRAMIGLSRFGLTGEHKLGAWLNTILSHVCSDQLTRASRDRELAQVMVAERHQEIDVADQVGDPGSRKAVQEVLAQLKPELRRVLVLREMRGLSYADVAAAENISEEHARVRAYRARNFMAERLTGFKSAAGALVLLPIGRFLRATSRLVRSHREKGAVVSPTAQVSSTSGVGGVPTALDRVASQLVGTPLTQTALAIVSSTPKGAVVFGVAAAVATFSVSAASLDNSRAAASSSSAETTALVIPATAAQNAFNFSPDATGAASSGPTGQSPDYGWTNAGLPGGSASGALSVATPTGTSPCVASNGVTPPGPGFSYGSVLPLTDQVAVGNTSAVDLTTTGGWMTFASAISITGSQTASSAVIDTNVCLLPGSPTQSWFTASVAGAGGSTVDLVGSLQAVIGSGNDAGYVFRGVVESTGGSGVAPIVSSTQFSALVQVREPDNTAELTVVFLSDQPSSTSAGAVSSPTTDAAGGGTNAVDSTSPPTSPVSDPSVPWTPPPGSTIPQSFGGGVQWVGFPGSGDGKAAPLTGGPPGPYSGF